jgi:hypothetical protein
VGYCQLERQQCGRIYGYSRQEKCKQQAFVKGYNSGGPGAPQVVNCNEHIRSVCQSPFVSKVQIIRLKFKANSI